MACSLEESESETHQSEYLKPYLLILESKRPFPPEKDVIKRISEIGGLEYSLDFNVKLKSNSLIIHIKNADAYDMIQSGVEKAFCKESVTFLLNYKFHDFVLDHTQSLSSVDEVANAIIRIIPKDSKLFHLQRFCVPLRQKILFHRIKLGKNKRLAHEVIVLGFRASKDEIYFLSLEKNRSSILTQVSRSLFDLINKQVHINRNGYKEHKEQNFARVEASYLNFPQSMPNIHSFLKKWNSFKNLKTLENIYRLDDCNCQDFVRSIWKLIKDDLPNHTWPSQNQFSNHIETKNDTAIHKKCSKIFSENSGNCLVNVYGEIGCGKSTAVLKTLHPENVAFNFTIQLHLDLGHLNSLKFSSASDFSAFVATNLNRVVDNNPKKEKPICLKANSMIFLDNLEHRPEKSTDILKKISTTDKAVIIITSQQNLFFDFKRISPDLVSEENCIKLHTFDEKECHEFLRKRFSMLQNLSSHHLGKIASYCNNNPLYLSFAVPFLSRCLKDEIYDKSPILIDKLIEKSFKEFFFSSSDSRRELSISKVLDYIKKHNIEEWLILEAASLLNGEFELKDFEVFFYIDKTIEMIKNTKFWPNLFIQNEIFKKGSLLEDLIKKFHLSQSLRNTMDILVQKNFLQKVSANKYRMNIFVKVECLKRITSNPFDDYKQQFVLTTFKQSAEASNPSSYLQACKNTEFLIAALKGQVVDDKLRIPICMFKKAIESYGIFKMPHLLIIMYHMLGQTQSQMLITILKECAQTGHGILEKFLLEASKKLQEITDFENKETIEDDESLNFDIVERLHLSQLDINIFSFNYLIECYYAFYVAKSYEIDEYFEKEIKDSLQSLKGYSLEVKNEFFHLLLKIDRARQLFNYFHDENFYLKTYLEDAFKSGNKSLRSIAFQLIQDSRINIEAHCGLDLASEIITACESSSNRKIKEVTHQYGYDKILLFKFTGVQSPSKRYLLFNGSSALHLAAYLGNTTLTEFLIHIGANVNERDHSNLSPLHYAAMEDHDEVVKLLVEAGSVLTEKELKEFDELLKALTTLLENSRSRDEFIAHARTALTGVAAVASISASIGLAATGFGAVIVVPMLLSGILSGTAFAWSAKKTIEYILKWRKRIEKIRILLREGGSINVDLLFDEASRLNETMKPTVYDIIANKEEIHRTLLTVS